MSFRHRIGGDVAAPKEAAAAVLIAIAVGALVASPRGAVASEAIVGCAAVVWIGRRNRGVVAGLLVLMVLNGVPFLNTQPTSAAGSNTFDDLSLLLLIGFAAWWGLRNPPTAVFRRTLAWAGGLLIWWAAAVLHAAIAHNIPLSAAAEFGREFAYFALLLPLLLRAFATREEALGLAATLCVAAAIFAVGQILAVEGHAVGGLIHIQKTADFDGTLRIYAPMNDLLNAVMPFTLAIALLGRGRHRWWALSLTILLAASVALSFVRAAYVADLAAVLIVCTAWLWRGGVGGRMIRRATYLTATGLTLAVFAGIPHAGGKLTPIVRRAELGLSDVSSNSGNFGYRIRQAKSSLNVLGPDWPTGLGFLPPQYHYVSGLRNGSIRDSDLGSLNIVMTMGLLGFVIVYIPAIAGLAAVWRRKTWAGLGASIAILTTLIGSITLDGMSSEVGLVTLACVMAVGLALSGSAGARRDSTAEAGGQ